MKRFGIMMRRHRWAVLAALALLVIAGTAAIFSGAVFNYQTANPANTFTAGNLKHTNSNDGSAILTATKMKPGDTANGAVTITNDGDLEGAFSLQATIVSDTAGPNGGNLSGRLQLVVTKDGAPFYSGLARDFAATAIDEGNWAVGAAHTYAFTVTFPDDGTPGSNTAGDNAYKASTLEIRYDWYQEQI